MKTNREKTTGVMGFVISVLLHGIFFAGCIALDYTNSSTTDNVDGTEIQKMTDEDVAGKTKS